MLKLRRISSRLTTGAFALIACLAGAPVKAEGILVFAAASLRESLEQVAAAWEADGGDPVVLSLAGSSTLARQIQAGAPADIYVSANTAWMDRLESQGLLRDGSRKDLLTNDLVVIASDSTGTLDFDDPQGMASRLGDDWLAMALVDAVPAGIYGKSALVALGWWDDVASQVAQTDNVRAALALVATGAAGLGIVYATDAMAEPKVDIIGTFPSNAHPPIRYPLAILADSTAPDAAAFAMFLAGPSAAEIFLRHGFGGADETRE